MALQVLLVEDDELLRGLTARILRGLGHDVVEARSGPEALAALAATPTLDVLFTDVKLGADMDGVALARGALAASPRLRVVLTSGDPSTFRLGADLGPRVATMAKPYRRAQIQVLLDEMADPPPTA